MTGSPSYHDLHITTPTIERISIFNLPFTVRVTCTRSAGWEVWEIHRGEERILGGEFQTGGLRLDVQGIIIVDTLEKS